MNPPSYFSDGRVEQDPEAWRDLLVAVLKAGGEQAEQRSITIAGISLTSQRSSMIPVDAEGWPLHPAIMWQDLRTLPLVTELESHSGLVQAKTGARISTVLSAIKMLWLRPNQPRLFALTHRMLCIHDFALHLLSGRFVTDHSLASRTNLLDLATRTWERDLISLFEVDPPMLCELVPPGSIVGAPCRHRPRSRPQGRHTHRHCRRRPAVRGLGSRGQVPMA